ncbi:MAG: hemerythrin domain-containing protein [Alphaproteobacteria bacterium]|nr:hemerythrin domain-containing protein [Alphaproteobacteria bacterium]
MPAELLDPSRRATLLLAGAAAALLTGCAKGDEGDEGVSATEDLMREHGVLRRILVVYRGTASLLRAPAGSLDVGALADAVALFQTFGEDYHERKLEEEYIFPTVKKKGGEAAALVATLLDQHKRGRELNAYIKAKCAAGAVGTGDVEPLAAALETFARMYEAHTAYEDTIVFQAWRASMSAAQLHDAGETFEDIERAQFKGDGFDLAVDQIEKIEERLGLHDLAHYTAPDPA